MSFPRKRRLISAFLAFLAAMVSCSLPTLGCDRAGPGWAAAYLRPLGLWHGWAMFAPDPPRETYALEADVADARGVRRRFAFPRMAGRPPWRSIWGYRHSKYLHRALAETGPAVRELAARHAVRSLHVPPDAFPVEVRLVQWTRPLPPPGGHSPEPWREAVAPLGRFRFSDPAEILK